ncbi:MAG: hypothetical protein LBQ54_02215 [Planctomycetaceae bacterium]|nr:hypothetical protein [Planctomycetaceae bacterium]
MDTYKSHMCVFICFLFYISIVILSTMQIVQTKRMIQYAERNYQDIQVFIEEVRQLHEFEKEWRTEEKAFIDALEKKTD